MDKYPQLAQEKVRSSLASLFADFTGLPLRATWAPPGSLSWDACMPLCRTALCQSDRAHPRRRFRCVDMATEHLAEALHETRGHSFVCPFGVRNFWLSVSVEGSCLGVLFFQGLTNGGAQAAGSGRRRTSTRKGADSERVAELGSASRTLSDRQFDQASELLRLVVDDLVQTILAEMRSQSLSALSRNVAVHEQMESHLRRELHKVLPWIKTTSTTVQGTTHENQVIQWMLRQIHENYQDPIRLQEFAKELGRSVPYLSNLFSKHVGLPFRSYVKELRLEKAQELLGRRPDYRISEIASLVGYTNPNRFRLDFKQRTGHSPSAWRQAVRSGAGDS